MDCTVNTLVLIPTRKSVCYAGFIAGRETCAGTIRGCAAKHGVCEIDTARIFC
jgi:hypothetical protein